MRRLIISFSILVLAAGSAWADPDRDARLDRVMALQQRQAERSASEFEDPELTPMLAEIKAVLDSARSVEQEIVASYPDGSADTPGSALACGWRRTRRRPTCRSSASRPVTPASTGAPNSNRGSSRASRRSSDRPRRALLG